MAILILQGWFLALMCLVPFYEGRRAHATFCWERAPKKDLPASAFMRLHAEPSYLATPCTQLCLVFLELFSAPSFSDFRF